MGQTQTAEEKAARKQNQRIAQLLKKDEERRRKQRRLLILGPGESGKTTLFRQLCLLYGNGKYGLENLRQRKSELHHMLIDSFRALLQASDLYFPLHDSVALQNEKELVLLAAAEFEFDSILNEATTDAMQKLWMDKAIRKTWTHRKSYFQAQDSLEYFMMHASRVFDKDYVVTPSDWLRTRVKTCGVPQYNLKFNNIEFSIFDAGGQTMERKKWLDVFNNDVSCVIFVAAISEYDEYMCENGRDNRMKDALQLFEQYANYDGFQNCGFVLFLNKEDVYRKKTLKFPIKHKAYFAPNQALWTDFTGIHDRNIQIDSLEHDIYCTEGINYFKKKFAARVRPGRPMKIDQHVTTAVDNENINYIFTTTWKSILHRSLSEYNLV